MSKPSFSDRIFRFLLRLLPFDFRADYGREMEEVFREQRAEAEKSEGKVGLGRVWWETIVGIVRTGPREHWEMLRQDAGYALRTMRLSMGYTLAAVLTLGLGIGANTAIFSMVYGVLLRPLPYGEGDELVRLRQEAPGIRIADVGFSEKELNDYRAQTQTLAGLVEYHNMQFILVGGEEPKRVQTGVVSPEYFDLFVVKPILGRTFRAEDDAHGADAVLVLSYAFWQKAFGGDPKIVGRVFQMNDRPHTVVGVLPSLPLYPDENDVYMPVSACPFRSRAQTRENRNARMVQVYARAKPGITPENVQADLTTIAKRLEAEYPANYPKHIRYGAAFSPLREELTSAAKPTLLVLLATAGFVLLIACANVANLTLSRLAGRQRELAVRLSLGASRVRLFRQLLTESTMLAVAGGALGLFLAHAGLDLLVAFAARLTPRAGDIRMDTTVLLFTLFISIFTGLVFGSLPAFSSARNLLGSLKEGGSQATAGPTSHRTRSLLLVSQVAFSVLLLIGAGLMLRSLVLLTRVNPGFNPENVLTARIGLNWSKYRNDNERRAFYRALLEKLGGHPGIVAKAATMFVPLNQTEPMFHRFQIEGRPVPEAAALPQADHRVASPEFFTAIGQPLLRGRVFTDMDHEQAPQVAMINQTFARQFFGNDDPVDQRVSFDRGETWMTIVGVVGGIKQHGLDKPATAELYQPFAQAPVASHVVVRTREEPQSMARHLRDVVRAIDPNQPVDQVLTMRRIRQESIATPRLTTLLLGIFAVLALVITGTGIAGVMGLAVSRRTHEIGIRMALGATPQDVARMVLGQGMALVGMGLALGLGGALWLAQLMSKLLFATAPTDPSTFLAVTMVLVGCAGMACWLPARRAAGIDPVVALRTE